MNISIHSGKGVLILLTAIFAFSTQHAFAQVNFTTDEAAFLAQNPNLATQDFESGNVAPDSVTQCSPVLNENTNDACFSPGDILPGLEFTQVPLGAHTLFIGGPDVEDNTFVVLYTDFNTDSMDITFPGNNVNVAGLILGCISEGGLCINTFVIRVFGEGDEFIGSTATDVTGRFDTFVGIQSSELITRINVASPTNGFEGLGRISFGLTPPRDIPALSEWGMIAAAAGLMLAGVFFAVRRRRRTSVVR
ncbi:MAG: hypothetical protein ACREOP_08640 [Thermodesulfobacteriota bacterium]